MGGGLLNIVSVGNANVFLTGNPTKTFFKVTYAKYTNFGLQRFRIDYDGMRDLRLTEDSKFTFKMKRYAELLMDTYIVITLPDIWSPAHPPSEKTGQSWSPYEFRWIDNLGALMIREIEILCGSYVLQRYSGQYVAAMVDRDFNQTKKDLFNRMTGNTSELNDPANWSSRTRSYPYQSQTYPTAMYSSTVDAAGRPQAAEPSIRGRQLYIPINAWFTLDSKCAFPLSSLQYNELIINVTLRPIQELFRVRDVFDTTNFFPYVKPDFNQERFQSYRFLQPPPSLQLDTYQNQTRIWNADVHILATYCFLSQEEQQVFAAQDQIYLVKDVFEYDYLNVTGSTKVKLESSSGMVSNWMFFYQRNDVNLRNEWSNYSNWPYEDVIPKNMILDSTSQLYITGSNYPQNMRDILQTFGIVIEGEYRENVLPVGIYDFVEKYTRTDGTAKPGLYCYNFGLKTSPFEYQPSGALNLSRFKNIEMEFTTMLPPVDEVNSQFNVVCDETGVPLTVSTKPSWAFYVYNYNLHVFEERYNVLSFIGGNCGLMYAR
jgi:hypothetical protein